MYVRTPAFLRACPFGLAAALSLFAGSASATTYNLVVTGGTTEAHVQPTMFGTNLAYDKVSLTEFPTFVSLLNTLGMKTLRYPGGTVTESDFDFKDSNGPSNDRISLTQFLQTCNTQGLTPLLVVPTKRFRTNYATTGKQYAKDFVKAVNINHGIAGGEQFGTTQTVTYWELGNEYYTDNTGGTPLAPSLYASIAQSFAYGMLTIDSSVVPVVQFERTDMTAAGTIAGSVSSPKACLTHLYPTADSGIDTCQTQLEDGASTFDLPVMVTEWNMGSQSGFTGLSLGNRLPKLLRAQVRAGVTLSTEWPLMWTNNSVNTRLANNDGTLLPPGQSFQWLTQSASGRDMVVTSSSSSALDLLAFKNGSSALSILVLCQSSATNSTINLTINGFNGSSFTVANARRMYAASGFGTNAEFSDTPALTTSLSYTKSGNVLTFHGNLSSRCEIIRIDLAP